MLAYMLGSGAVLYLVWHAIQRADRPLPSLTPEPEGRGQGVVWYQYRGEKWPQKITAAEVHLLPTVLNLRQVVITKGTDRLQAGRASMEFAPNNEHMLAIFASTPTAIELQEKVKLESDEYVLQTDAATYEANVVTGQGQVTVVGPGISLGGKEGFSYHLQSGRIEFRGKTTGEVDAKLPQL